MKGATKEQLAAMNVIEFAPGKYRAMTREEKLNGVAPAPKRRPKANGITTGYFDGMTLEQIMTKYSGGPEGIYIPGNVPSSKNNRGLMRVSKVVKQSPMMVTGTLIPSPQTQAYKKDTKQYWEKLAPVFRHMIGIRTPPYTISFFFIHKTQHASDYINRAQTVQDIMTDNSWIGDDNFREVIPDFSEGCAYDKNFPGVIIKVK